MCANDIGHICLDLGLIITLETKNTSRRTNDFITRKEKTMNRSKIRNKTKTLIKLTICLFVLFYFNTNSLATPANYEMPSNIDRSIRYFFFLHNYYVETQGPNGACKYYDILQTFADSGFKVISEVRSGEIVPSEYAKKIVQQVKRLLDAGVAPEHITIAGHSKGGVIAICVASQLENPKIRYIIMAGCGIKTLEPDYPDFTGLKGNFLSVYASSDSIASSCNELFSKANKEISNKEVKLESEKGHKLFFAPEDIWIEPVMVWIEEKK